jgi:hypothetical protein
MEEIAGRGPVAELPPVRSVEGSQGNKKWASIELKKDEKEYIVGGKVKPKASKERKEKNLLGIDFTETGGGRSRGGDRGGRRGGGGGGGRSREGRGDRRGGGRGGSGTSFNIQDTNAFPDLGK